MIKLSSLDFAPSSDADNFAHSFHPYPAKFPPQIPNTLLRHFSTKGETVLDPFCGSGTTLIEAKRLGCNVIGIDSNALACLLSKVKATSLTNNQIILIETFLQNFGETLLHWQMGQRDTVIIPDFDGIHHWFQQNVAEELTYILEQINKIVDIDVRDFFKVALSSIIVRVSNQESDTRFAAIQKNIPNNFTLSLFLEKSNIFLKGMQRFSKEITTNGFIEIYNADSRNLEMVADNSIDMIITSPPYANTYDYYLYHKFRKRWLGLDVASAQSLEIGSRREFSSLKRDPQKWIVDLKQCFNEMYRVLKPQKAAFIVIGDSVIRGEMLHIDQELTQLAPECGFTVCDIISTDLAKHSKLFNPAFVKKGKQEHIMHLRRN